MESVKRQTRWRNKKTGHIYLVVDIIQNTTDGQEDQKMILYQRYGYSGAPLYVRESSNFLVKFDLYITPELVSK